MTIPYTLTKAMESYKNAIIVAAEANSSLAYIEARLELGDDLELTEYETLVKSRADSIAKSVETSYHLVAAGKLLDAEVALATRGRDERRGRDESM